MRPEQAPPSSSCSAAAPPFSRSTASRQLKTFGIFATVLAVCFAFPLYELVRFAADSTLFSYILLIPVVSAYLVWGQRESLPPASKPTTNRALVPFVAGVTVLIGYWLAARSGMTAVRSDHLTWTTLSFLLFFVGVCFLTLGPATLKAIAFPLGFLVFIIPFPAVVVEGTESFLQYASAIGADWLFTATGMSFFRNGLLFQLPGIQLRVAPECSGIHSSLVLFVTSLVAGQMFLRTGWKRALLALAVIPLGILRNAVRIVTIGQLCVHVSPSMIDSPIHHRGGPLFFAVSLVPLFILLFYLRRSERLSKPPSNAILSS